MNSLNAPNRRLESSPLPTRQRPERRTSPGLAAYHWNGPFPRLDTIRDISSTGAYLLTQERWTPGQLLSLTLQRIGPPEQTPERRIEVQAKAVRCGEDGIGVSFVLPAGADLRLWQSPLKSAAEQTEPEDVLREFRIARALAFLRRICPLATGQVGQLLHEELSNLRLESTLAIIHNAENMHLSSLESGQMLAHPDVVLRILDGGSWSDDPLALQFWAGLLATSCSPGGQDESNLAFVNLLSQLTSIDLRVLATACTKAQKVSSGFGRVSSRPLAWSADELKKITGSHDLIRIDRDLEHLSDLGLIAERVKSTFFSPISDTKITPTSLGLELYARCNGHRGTPHGFYGLATPSSPVMDEL